MSETDINNSEAQAQIMAHLQAWTQAVQRKDLEAIKRYYDETVVAYDAIGQLQFSGLEAYGKHWAFCLNQCSGPMVFELRAPVVHVDGTVAFAHWLNKCGDGECEGSWMRASAGYRLTEQGWKAVHEHFSAPFDMSSGKARFDLKPEGTADTVVKPIPDDYHSLTAYLVVKGAADAIQFYQKAFGFREAFRLDGPDGRVGHAELRIGDSRLMISDGCDQGPLASPESRPPSGMHLYVENADTVFKRAVEAGAVEVDPVKDQFYGDRMGTLRDPYGHIWFIATHIEELSHEQIKARAREMWSE